MNRKCFWLYGCVASPDSHALEIQMESLRRFAEKRKLNVVGQSQDEQSGLTFDRPGVMQFLNSVRERKVDELLVKDLSQLGRDYIQVGRFLDDLNRSGIEVFETATLMTSGL